MNMNGENNDGDNEESWGRDRRAPVDDGWGRIRSINGSVKTLKTKGLWVYARHTLTCDYPNDPPRINIPSITALAAE